METYEIELTREFPGWAWRLLKRFGSDPQPVVLDLGYRLTKRRARAEAERAIGIEERSWAE